MRFKTPSILVASACITLSMLAYSAAAEEPFTIAIIPDSQYLVAYAPQYWTQQCQWIVDNQAARNIKAVIHVGDLVDSAQQSHQWTNALAGLDILKAASIPVILAPGNHDMDLNPVPQAMTNLTERLPQSWFTSNTNWHGGFLDSSNLAGSYLLVENGETTYVIVALAWLPDNRSAQWGREIMQQFSNCPAIFATHCYVDDTDWGRRASWTQQWGVERLAGGDQSPWWTPNRLWNDWFSSSKNLFWVVSGHLSVGLNSIYFSEPAEDGHLITQSLCDYQLWQPSKSMYSGVMQLLTINPSENECHIETFSTRTGEILTNWNENYTFPLYSTNQTHFSRWQQAQAAASGLILRNGFDSTNADGFIGSSAFKFTLTGAVATAPGGIYVNCYPALSNMVMASDIDALTGLSNVTISAWFKGTNPPPSGIGTILGKFGGGVDGEWYLSTLNASHIRWALVNTGNLRINLDAATPSPVLDGNWHHLAASYDGSVAKLFFDGKIIGARPFSGRLKGTRHLVCVGGTDVQASPYASIYTPMGWIDRVKVWSVALSEDQIAANYVRELTTLKAVRTNAVSSLAGTNLDFTVQPGIQYFLRFAVTETSQTNASQRIIVSWNGSAIADLPLVPTNDPGAANWIYSSALVSSTNNVAGLQLLTVADDMGTESNAVAATDAQLGDVTLVPFSLPEVSLPAISYNGAIKLAWPAFPGIAYQLQSSADLVNWTALTDWYVTSETNLTASVARPNPAEKQFFRVQARW